MPFAPGSCDGLLHSIPFSTLRRCKRCSAVERLPLPTQIANVCIRLAGVQALGNTMTSVTSLERQAGPQALKKAT